MNFETLLSRLIDDSTASALGLFTPELALCATIVALMLGRLFPIDRWFPPYWIAMLGTAAAFGLAFSQMVQFEPELLAPPQEFFTGLLVYDRFTLFFRLFLLLFVILTIALTVVTGIPDYEDGPDFYTLLLGSAIGMLLMASANHLLILFLGVEMASVPSYAMVGFLKGRRQSSEAALKFVVYGAGAAGVMLYGISLLAGLLGTANLPEMATRLQVLLATEGAATDPIVRTVLLAILMVLVGLAFKLSLVPFHFWCPDAFHGASAEVAGYLSVASKAAAFALLVRFMLAFVTPEIDALARIAFYIGVGLAVISIVTMTFGNLAAYAQTNAKRLLAYSTIAHAGYMLMAVSALLVLLSAPAVEDRLEHAYWALGGLLFYLAAYLFMNLGAFAIVAFLRNSLRSEEIEDYAGLIRRAPWMVICFSLILFSLVGLPPLAGFLGKFAVFAALADGYVATGDAEGSANYLLWLLVIGGVNTAISLFYYLRVVKVMTIDPEPETRVPFTVGVFPVAYVVLLTFPLVVLIFTWNFLNQWTLDAARQLL